MRPARASRFASLLSTSSARRSPSSFTTSFLPCPRAGQGLDGTRGAVTSKRRSSASPTDRHPGPNSATHGRERVRIRARGWLNLLVIFAVLALAACSGGGDPDAACARWETLKAAQASDAEAVTTLNAIADEAETRPVREHALDLAILLEGTATQTEVHAAYQELDAACDV